MAIFTYKQSIYKENVRLLVEITIDSEKEIIAEDFGTIKSATNILKMVVENYELGKEEEDHDNK